KTALYLILGLAGLFIGGEMVVKNAVKIARMLNVGEKLIALTIVALGTSLPEFVTSVIAITKRRYDLAVGNVIGSNLFNLFMVLGVTALIRPIEYPVILNLDFYFLIGITLFFLLTMFTGKKQRIDRWEAFLFVMLYLVYLIIIIHRR
ncbi:MAG: sodium:calcium antiporter, partial [Candidatus Cloacimonetes bacterium]|nr:sodium:calcium antiporter [Candidatus Cloacimonadota bacterium]